MQVYDRVMKPPADPFSLDFAALRTLRLVHGYGSFSRAAESLGVNQSTVSYTIDRLRKAFSDPLFVRQGGGIVATERCEEIVAAANRMLDTFASLTEPRAFDPAGAEATLTISCNYYERATLLPTLARRLRRIAPGLRLSVRSSLVRGKEQLDRGESDLLIGPVPIGEGEYYRRTVLSDHYVCIMAHDAPEALMPRDVASYLAAPMVVVNYGGSWRSRFLLEVEAAGHSLNRVMEVSSHAALPEILEGTDLVSTVPLRLARHFGDSVRIGAAPFRGEFSIDLTWTARTHHSPMHVWLRDQIARLA